MSTSIPKELLSSWSIAPSDEALEEIEQYVLDDYDSGEFEYVECWRGDATGEPLTVVEVGDVLDYGRTTSWALQEYSARMFADIAQEEHGGSQVLYHLDGAEMLDVSYLSDRESECEIFSHPQARFGVLSCEYDEYDDIYFVELEQL